MEGSRGVRIGVTAGLIVAAAVAALLWSSAAGAAEIDAHVQLGDGYTLYLWANGREGRDRPHLGIVKEVGDRALTAPRRT